MSSYLGLKGEMVVVGIIELLKLLLHAELPIVRDVFRVEVGNGGLM